jgi:hypothetical protein
MIDMQTMTFMNNDRTRSLKATTIDGKVELRVMHDRLHVELAMILTDDQVADLRDWLNKAAHIPNFTRVAGTLVCHECQKTLYHHKKHPKHDWLTAGCDGIFYKL